MSRVTDLVARARTTLRELHEDESGPNTVEWVLLLIVGLMMVIAIFAFARWAVARYYDRASAMQDDPFVNN